LLGGSAHEEHHAALAALAGDDAPPAATRLPAVAARPRWRRTYARFTPGSAAFVTIVLEAVGPPQEIIRVEAFLERPACAGAVRTTLGRGAVWLAATPFPDDPGLPALPAVLARCDDYEVVRYRPGRRCTLRALVAGEPRYAKVLADARAQAIHRAAVELWEAAARRELRFAVAVPDGCDPATNTVWQHALAGTAVKERLLASQGPALAERLGAALASLARSSAQPAVVRNRWAAFSRTMGIGRDLVALVPGLGARVDALLAEIRRLHDAAPARPLRPVHGAPHPRQWVELDGDIGLVDFDDFALGERELDVAVFLAAMDAERGAHAEAVNPAFLAGYEAVAGPLDRALLAGQRAAERLAKARRSAWAVRPDGDERAGRDLARAWEPIEQHKRAGGHRRVPASEA
jgi:Phosphotransferase enzyme family